MDTGSEFELMKPPVAILVICVGLGASIVLPWETDLASKTPEQTSYSISLSSDENELYTPPIVTQPTQFSEIWERPLFAPTRRPVVQQVPDVEAEPVAEIEAVAEVPDLLVPPEDPAPQPPELRLAGLRQIDGTSEVLVVELSSGMERWHSVGDVIGVWEITSISDSGMQLSTKGNKISVNFY